MTARPKSAAIRKRPKPPTPAPADSRFAAWIDEVTPRWLAEKMGITIYAVHWWRRGARGDANGCLPRGSKLAHILQLAGGKLTAADIYSRKG